MEYGALIREAWTITRRYRFLWAFGLFAGGAVGAWTGGGAGGNGPQHGMGPQDVGAFGPQAEHEAAQVAAWIMEHFALMLGAAAVLMMLGLALVVLALIAQGAMAEATAEVASGQPSSFGHAWRVGRHLFWRYVGLWLSLGGAGVVLAALLAAFAAAAIGIAQVVGPTATTVLVPIALILGVPLALAVLVGGIALSVVVAYAQRAIAVEDVGPLASLRSGWGLLRAHLRQSALLWLINVGLAIGAGLAAGLLVLALAAVLMGVGMLLYTVIGMGAAIIAYAAVGCVAMLAALLLAAAVVNTFFWSYWSLAYLRLSGRTPQLATA